VFVVTDASGTFNAITRDAAWDRMSNAGVQLMSWFGVACELHRDWRNDIEGLGNLFSNHIPDYRNLMTGFNLLNASKLILRSPPVRPEGLRFYSVFSFHFSCGIMKGWINTPANIANAGHLGCDC
jgi:hypothetical protein